MVALRRLLLIVACCLMAAACGCALSKPSKPSAILPPPTPEEAAWWEANRSKAVYVPGRGYYVEGTSGFFDYDGRKLKTDLVHSGTIAEEDNNKGFIDRISPKNNYKKLMVAIGKGPNEQIARKNLAEGDALFRQKKFKEAAEKYRVAYKRWPDSPLEEEAIYKAAESYFFADRYSNADDEYALLIKKFPSTQYLSQAVIRRFSIGRYWDQYATLHPQWPLTANWTDKTRPMFDTGGHAIRVYERIRLDDPTGPLADDSVMAAASYFFTKGRWDDADYHYSLLRTEFPKSEHQYQAHLLGLRCKLLKYQGPGYEGAPLDEAEELATQLLTQFPKELGDERDKVVQVRAGIRAQRALREWEMAEYYAKGEYYAAARVYYAKVIKDYPETRIAEDSRTRLAEYKEKPDSPTPPFQWLADLLPESKKEGPVLPKNLANATATAAAPSTAVTR